MAYTSHGQQIWGTPVGLPYLGKYINCGGARVCETCKRESALYHHPSNTKKKEQST